MRVTSSQKNLGILSYLVIRSTYSTFCFLYNLIPAHATPGLLVLLSTTFQPCEGKIHVSFPPALSKRVLRVQQPLPLPLRCWR